ncbi:UNKNOWN [Stylonychia lemnae]|uniref:START domain-containing protein n=1 Tax=Stylonychia lemnae TaxID=5949 RepID=A0A077ZPC5_STYLE|nr:UNKNOWN [Stylonychia lemnae]|eukprot:CDW71245.1 UNKNOWN [Stylonychia lemnae]
MQSGTIIRYNVQSKEELAKIFLDPNTRQLWDQSSSSINIRSKNTFIELSKNGIQNKMVLSLASDQKGWLYVKQTALEQSNEGNIKPTYFFLKIIEIQRYDNMLFLTVYIGKLTQINEEQNTRFSFPEDITQIFKQTCQDFDKIVKSIDPEINRNQIQNPVRYFNQIKEQEDIQVIKEKAKVEKPKKSNKSNENKAQAKKKDEEIRTEAEQKLTHIDSVINYPDWEMVTEDKKKKFVQYKRVSERGHKSLKVEFISHYSLDYVVKMFFDEGFQQKMNEKVEYQKVMETIVPDETEIIYQKMKKMPFFSEREMLFVRHRHSIDEKTYAFIIYSIQRDDLVAQNKDVVRVWVEFISYKLEAIDSSSTKITHTLEMDMKSKIPDFVINKIHKEMGQKRAALDQSIQEYIKEQNKKKK